MEITELSKSYIISQLTTRYKKLLIRRYKIITEYNSRVKSEQKKVILIDLSIKYNLSIRNIQRITRKKI
jgi:hypothetical protein